VKHMFKILIRVGTRLPLFDRFAYVEMKRFLMIKNALLCRLSTGAPVCSVHGHPFSVRRTATCLWRCLHSWRTRRGSLLSNIGDIIIYGLIHHRSRGLHSAWLWPCIDLFIHILCWTLNNCVHLTYVEARCNG
jgi:hypothetical protein